MPLVGNGTFRFCPGEGRNVVSTVTPTSAQIQASAIRLLDFQRPIFRVAAHWDADGADVLHYSLLLVDELEGMSKSSLFSYTLC